MKRHPILTGIFVLGALSLFAAGLFLIGNRHNAFSRHVDFYTEFTDVNGIEKGSKVRVSGFDAGTVEGLEIPARPEGRFRLRLLVDSKMEPMIRRDSIVSVESDGLVGDKFLFIHEGSNGSPAAAGGDTLPSREPVELSSIMNKVTGMMDQANATMGDLRGRLDTTLDAIHATVTNADGMVTNANGMVSDVRRGKGAVGLLLNDPQTASQVKDAIAHTRQATANLDRLSAQAEGMLTDLAQRDLAQKAEDTLNNAKDATLHLDQTSRQMNDTLTEALGPDHFGEDAGANLRETLSNVNLATANVADDTEALKHEFFFRGFFRKRGFYSLHELTPQQYRDSRYFQDGRNRRDWLNAQDTFMNANGELILSAAGKAQIDQFIGANKDSALGQQMVVEGYANEGTGADQMMASRSRTILVAHYLERRFHISARDIGLMPLNATPPASAGKESWNGASIVLLAAK